MKRKTALWQIKIAYKKWGGSPEFFQEVSEILKKFEKDCQYKAKRSYGNETERGPGASGDRADPG